MDIPGAWRLAWQGLGGGGVCPGVEEGGDCQPPSKTGEHRAAPTARHPKGGMGWNPHRSSNAIGPPADCGNKHRAAGGVPPRTANRKGRGNGPRFPPGALGRCRRLGGAWPGGVGRQAAPGPVNPGSTIRQVWPFRAGALSALFGAKQRPSIHGSFPLENASSQASEGHRRNDWAAKGQWRGRRWNNRIHLALLVAHQAA